MSDHAWDVIGILGAIFAVAGMVVGVAWAAAWRDK